ncbi:Phage minor capsid protein 2 [Microbacterium hydrothermale]|uniref:phage minor capsid protein n=1 Tax=Microbacterium hydrothermale TaxID=857427 RepID=UPI002227FE08|nr:phage minor capsid protein [Microbacterium hydrothermale]MCW2165393.1 Phage minor capsid protein 2 [Microbacterium hydrothermale]
MARFKPDPDRTIEDIVEDLGREISDRFRDAEDAAIAEVARRARRDLQLASQLPDATVAGGLTVAQLREQNRILAELAAHRARTLAELARIGERLASDLRPADLAARLVGIAALEGEAAAAASLGLGAGRLRPVPFTSTAVQAASTVAVSLENRLTNLKERITRYPRDAYQRVVSLYTPATLLGTQTAVQQQARIVQAFLAEGITGFVDRGGRRWTIGAYAEMAGRTSVARAYNDAGVWRMQQSGVQLGTISGAADACRKCAPWIGKIVSFDGTEGDVVLPHSTRDEDVTVHIDGTLSQARAAGWGHPNDRCKVIAYSPGLAIPQRDFEYDKQAEHDREEQRRLEREIRSAKRDEAAAMTDADRKRAARDVAKAQAEMRGFLEQTGRTRARYREQLHFADGR